MPSAVRKNANTIKIRVKLVITSTSEGASTKSVMTIMILSVLTSSFGWLGGVSERLSCGICTAGGIFTFGLDCISCVRLSGVALSGTCGARGRIFGSCGK